MPSLKPQPRQGAMPRGREIAWRRSNEETLRALAGQWVVVEGEKLIAHGDDPLTVVQEARARGVHSPYVFYVEAPCGDVATIGL